MYPFFPDRPFLNPRHRTGLTLFELLIVMSILATLVALIIGLGRHADVMAKRHQAVAELGIWHEALHRYYAALGQYPDAPPYPTSVTNLLNVKHVVGGAAATPVTIRFGDRTTVALNPIDPWRHPYQYVAATNDAPQSYDLFSQGPDGANGTSDDVRFK